MGMRSDIASTGINVCHLSTASDSKMSPEWTISRQCCEAEPNPSFPTLRTPNVRSLPEMWDVRCLLLFISECSWSLCGLKVLGKIFKITYHHWWTTVNTCDLTRSVLGTKSTLPCVQIFDFRFLHFMTYNDIKFRFKQTMCPYLFVKAVFGSLMSILFWQLRTKLPYVLNHKLVILVFNCILEVAKVLCLELLP